MGGGNIKAKIRDLDLKKKRKQTEWAREIDAACMQAGRGKEQEIIAEQS